MVNRNIDSIIYQAYKKLGQVTYDITKEAQDGIGIKSSKWEKIISIDNLLELIGQHIEVRDNSVYRILGLSDIEMNKLLSCLIEQSNIYDYPTAAFLPCNSVANIQNVNGGGPPGPPGSNGASAYAAIAYASDSSGTDFSTNPGIGLNYVAFIASPNPIPMIVTTFIGKFKKYVGTDGAPGAAGTAGTTFYTYIRYAADSAGTDFNAIPSSTRKYASFLITSVYSSNPPSNLFTDWQKWLGDNGTTGTAGVNGKTILNVSGAPSSLVGVDGDYAIDTTNYTFYGPKGAGVWPSGFSLVGPSGPTGSTGAGGTNGTNGTNGANAFLYVAWADDPSGLNFTMTFDPNKEWISFLSTSIAIPIPVVGDFAGKWAKYRGAGDRWATTSITPMTIGTGTRSLIVDKGLAYTTGQRIVIAQDGVPGNRMEGYVIGYDQITGQFSADITDAYGAGNYASWDVNIQGVPTQGITDDSFFAEINTDGNQGGTPQTLSTAFQKITQFQVVGDVSSGMTGDATNDKVIIGTGGEFHLYFNASYVSPANTKLIFQFYKNSAPIAGLKAEETTNANGDFTGVKIAGIKALAVGDFIEVYVKATAGTPSFLLEEGTFGCFTTGTPAAPEYTKFGGINFDTGVGVIIDAFVVGLGNYVIWNYKIKKGDNIRGGTLTATWNSVGALIPNNENLYPDQGTVTPVLSADVNAGTVRLLATLISDDWEISGNRYIL